MACCGGSSSVVIVGGANTIVTGSGTVSDPYVISGNLEVILQANDTETITMDLTGAGSANDPFVLTATATVSVNDLVDVEDPTPPVPGDALVFGTNGKWEYATPTPVDPGAINATGGIEGNGTLGTPLKINVSNALENAVTGLYTYIDVNGELRVEVPAASAVSWGNITGKPSAFPPERPLTADFVANSFTPGVYPGVRIFVGPTTPVGATDNDIWFQTT